MVLDHVCEEDEKVSERRELLALEVLAIVVEAIILSAFTGRMSAELDIFCEMCENKIEAMIFEESLHAIFAIFVAKFVESVSQLLISVFEDWSGLLRFIIRSLAAHGGMLNDQEGVFGVSVPSKKTTKPSLDMLVLLEELDNHSHYGTTVLGLSLLVFFGYVEAFGRSTALL